MASSEGRGQEGERCVSIYPGFPRWPLELRGVTDALLLTGKVSIAFALAPLCRFICGDVDDAVLLMSTYAFFSFLAKNGSEIVFGLINLDSNCENLWNT